MKQNRYSRMAEQFHADDQLKNETRAFLAAKRSAASAPKQRTLRWKPALACSCVLAAALVAIAGMTTGQPQSQMPAGTFGFVAYAADQESGPSTATRLSDTDFLALDQGHGYGSASGYVFSGTLLRVVDPNVKKLDFSIDKGQIYCDREYAYIRNDQASGNAGPDGTPGPDESQIEEILQKEGVPDDAYTRITPDETMDGHWHIVTHKALGSHVTVDYQQGDAFGFGMTPEMAKSAAPAEDQDLKESWADWLHYFDGATLTVTATFADGTQKTETKHLTSGYLKEEEVAVTPGGIAQNRILPELADRTKEAGFQAVYPDDFVQK